MNMTSEIKQPTEEPNPEFKLPKIQQKFLEQEKKDFKN